MNPRYFTSIREISHDDFYNAWEREEQTSGHEFDKNANDRLKNQRIQTSGADLHFHIGTLTQDGLSALVLPWHDEGYKIDCKGQPLWDVVTKYLPGIHTEPDSDPCFKRLRRVMGELDDKWFALLSGSLLETDYVLGRIYDDPELAMEGHYRGHPTGKVYVGNTHRFLGYGLWVKQGMRYHPFKVYYCGK